MSSAMRYPAACTIEQSTRIGIRIARVVGAPCTCCALHKAQCTTCMDAIRLYFSTKKMKITCKDENEKGKDRAK